MEETCPAAEKGMAETRIADFVSKNPLVTEMYSVMQEQLGFDKLCMVPVNHCLQAYCALIVNSQHGNILYSGDTVPCNGLINYAQTAKVLIHEATL